MRNGVGWAMHRADVLVTGPAWPYSLGEAGALGAELAWHSGCPDTSHTSSNLSQRVGVLGRESSGLGPGKACLGGRDPRSPPLPSQETLSLHLRVGTADSVLGEGPAALDSLTGVKKDLNVSL